MKLQHTGFFFFLLLVAALAGASAASDYWPVIENYHVNHTALNHKRKRVISRVTAILVSDMHRPRKLYGPKVVSTTSALSSITSKAGCVLVSQRAFAVIGPFRNSRRGVDPLHCFQ